MFGVVWVDPEYVGTTIAVLWGVVLVGGLGGLALQAALPESGIASFGRLLTGASVFVLLPTVTLSCTAVFG